MERRGKSFVLSSMKAFNKMCLFCSSNVIDFKQTCGLVPLIALCHDLDWGAPAQWSTLVMQSQAHQPSSSHWSREEINVYID